MKSIVDILVRPYFEDPASEFDSNTFYLGYQLVEEPINVRINSLIYQFIVGHIEYRRKDSLICSSSSEYLVKYCECSESEPDSQVFGPFITELHFFRTLLPALDRVRPISHTFVKFCNSNISAPATSNKTAMLFKWPEGARLSEKIPVRSLGSERCSSMLKSIARLHAQSLQLCRNDPDGVFQISPFTNPLTALFDLDSVLSVLRECHEKLLLAREFPDEDGVKRFGQMLDKFARKVHRAFQSSKTPESCWVLCHRNFGQENVLFKEAEGGLDAIIYNCQSMGFASLGVDIAIPLFVELAAHLRNSHVRQLLGDYHAQFEQIVGNLNVPAPDCIRAQLKKAVPFALYTLARRILSAKSEVPVQNTLFRTNEWNEELMVNLCAYLIFEDFI